MPRAARKQSQSQIYHVMLRGINRQQIFFDDEDCRYYIRLLDRFKKTCGYELYAYCLMGNHIHLLIHAAASPIGKIFEHINTAFVYWYNIKYERSGHLFQDRFKSEVVDSQQYLLTVFRYILQNPVKAGICHTPEEYQYSSACEYLNGRSGITDTRFFKEMMSLEALTEFIHQKNDDQCMDIEEMIPVRLTDEKAKALILKTWGTCSPTVGKKKDRQTLEVDICGLIKKGISVRQLSRLTGISRKIIMGTIDKKGPENRPLVP